MEEVHYDAHHVFMTLPGYTSTREDDVQWVAEAAMRHPIQEWCLLERLGPG